MLKHSNTASNTPKTKENLKSYHMTPLSNLKRSSLFSGLLDTKKVAYIGNS